MSLRVLIAMLLFLLPGAAGLLRGTEPEKFRPYDGSQGYAVFAGSTSPDGAWALAMGTAGLAPEAQARLTDWPADLEIKGDQVNIANFLFDVRQKRVAGVLPEFDFFDGHGWRKNHGELYWAWTPDSRHALAICEERWDDAGIVWIDTAAKTFPSVKAQMEKAYGAYLRAHEKKPTVADMHFQDPVAMGAEVIALDAWSQVPKADEFAHYRLKMRFTPGKGGAVRCEILAGHQVTEKESIEPPKLEEEETLNAFYERLEAKLPAKARPALAQEQEAWKKWRDAQPEDLRTNLTSDRSALLRARVELGP